MKKLFILLFAAFACFGTARADEGMWLPSLIGTRITDMRSKGFKLTAEDVYSINHASLKDGIVRFGRGCTAELISGQGLLLTNHHCGYNQIQSHSSVEHDYLTNGFWAMNRGEELPNPDLTVTFLVRMEDVTDRVLDGVAKLSKDKQAARIDKNIKKIVAGATKGTNYTASVEPFYYGNQYFLFINEVYRDVRLVAAPPSSIGKFGGDTDNWMWPRHTGDFSIFRIYADKDNKPAEYSKDNVPYTPKKFFGVSTKGVKEGDFTMVYGFPGRTNQYLVSEAVDYVLNKSNPVKIDLRTKRLDIIHAMSAGDPATRIAYAAKAAYMANAWKKWQGESLGLERLGTIYKKQDYEARFKEWAKGKPEYVDVVDNLNNDYRKTSELLLVQDYYTEAILAMEFASFAKSALAQNGDKEKLTELAEKHFKDYVVGVDMTTSRQMLAEYVSNVEGYVPAEILSRIKADGGTYEYIKELFAGSALVSREKFAALLETPDISKALAGDPGVKFFEAFKNIYDTQASGAIKDHNKKIGEWYKLYVKGMMEMERDRNTGRVFFPDANSTLRVAYGAIEGYVPEDGVVCVPRTTIDGIIAKDNPDIYDYDIPQRLRDVYMAKDYGRWVDNGTVPVCFMATNHTTGGNSGSPVLNGDGDLVGLNFDRTWLSTMSDIEFDPVMCRNIALDIRYVLFVLDKIGHAGYLLDEMELK